VIIKTEEPQLVASIRRIMPRYDETGPLFGELYAYLAQCNVNTLVGAVWHDEGYKEQDVDAEAVAYLKSPTPKTEQVKVYTLPAVTVASLIHNGAYNRFQQAYAAINAWIDSNGYRIVGPTRELYHYSTFPVTQDNESYVTEIQFPVEKS